MARRKIHLAVGRFGEVVIPPDVRAALDMQDGDRLVARIADGAIVLEPLEAKGRRARALARRHLEAGARIVNELLAERRPAPAQG